MGLVSFRAGRRPSDRQCSVGLGEELLQRLVLIFVIVVSNLLAGCETRPETKVDSGEPVRDTFVGTMPGDTTTDASFDIGDVDNELPDGGALIENVEAVPNPSNALSYFVEWSTTAKASTGLVVECGDDWRQTYWSDGRSTEHDVFVMGLWAGATCTFTAYAVTADGVRAAASTQVEVGPVAEHLPKLTVGARKEKKMQAGWTLFNVTNWFKRPPLTVAMVDSEGRYRWYHQLSTSDSGDDTVVEVIDDGAHILVGGNRKHRGPRLLDWEGNVVWKEDFQMHHDIQATEDGKYFYFLTRADNCQGSYNTGVIAKYSREKEKVVERWPFCHYYTPPQKNPKNDWDHLNAIEFFPNGEDVLLSGRHLHTLYKFDLESEKLEWKLGLHGEFGLPDTDQFYRQHAPEIQPNGNILVYDNGTHLMGVNRRYSRALEISYDADEMTAKGVWSYVSEAKYYTWIWGDADRLENGNTLITYGYRHKKGKPSTLQEVTPSKQKVWELQMPVSWSWYRAERITEMPTGYVKKQASTTGGTK